MYLKNQYYLERLMQDDIRYLAKIKLNNLILTNKDIKSIKYDLNVNESEKFRLGGVYGANVDLTLLNYENEFNNVKFDNKEFDINLKIDTEDLYSVGKTNNAIIRILNLVKVKQLSSLWIPQGFFYPTKVVKNENKTITINLIDKTKYLEDEYICTLTPPFTLKQLFEDVHSKSQIITDTTTFYNEDVIINSIPTGYTATQILSYIAECACGFYIINRLGHGEIRTFKNQVVKTIDKGKYRKFLPEEKHITIQKIKYAGEQIIGSETGYVLELEEENPFINDTIAQRILLRMQGFTFLPYSYKASVCDIAMDICDKFAITDTNNVAYEPYLMHNSWEFSGALSQEWNANAENELNNTYSSKGPLMQQIDKIVNKEIPNIYNKAVETATELLTQFNGGYVVKKDGELFICDNEDIDRAQKVWRWNINGLGYSSTGINGPYRFGNDNEWANCGRFYYNRNFECRFG